MQLKTASELNQQDLIDRGLGDHYTTFSDDCGLCGEDVGGVISTVPVVSIVEGTVVTELCVVHTDEQGIMRVSNPDEFVRCFG